MSDSDIPEQRRSAFVATTWAVKGSFSSVYAFRPFFLLAAVWSIVVVGLSTTWASGYWSPPGGMDPYAWHAHELLFGYGAAAVAGFLLTAAPNWTGRPPLSRTPLLGLVVLWLAGRAITLAPVSVPDFIPLAVDGSFLSLVTAIAARDTIAARYWRNLKVVGLVAIHACANLGYWAAVMLAWEVETAIRIGLAALIGLCIMIGGRMINGFTRSWFESRGMDRTVPYFDTADRTALCTAAIAGTLWLAQPASKATGAALLIAGVANAYRLWRWQGWATWCEPMVFILHVGYGFIVAGFLLCGIAATEPQVISPSAALHAWSSGAIGCLTLAVMTRAPLGHAGQPPEASIGTCLSYGAVIVASVARIGAGFTPAMQIPLTTLAGATWVGGFTMYVACYGSLLVGRRQSCSS